jgi:hypothetical protein
MLGSPTRRFGPLPIGTTGAADRGKDVVARALAIDPDFRLSGLADISSLRCAEDRARCQEGLRKAGFPE